ncbi:glucose dehydrogenase [FAD, quinone]-like [Melitaea cinxia]|uniref:glucose dehydrogenase [FAD, quinone]-like n=1 Tax=Melitaea cinxia TaxID=113334 RepID=UPI001E273AC0|nr:glucose dehydrogenase [FAD, quinone]-like [Melitaea cinxia]
MNNGNTNCSTTTGVAPQIFASAIHFIAATQCFMPENSFPYYGDNDTYDFIIVGGGSAGSVVANRLSENKAWKILLLEAGPEPPIESDIPSMTPTLFQSKYSWQYFTQNDGIRHQAFKTGSVFWPRGKMLGGSSSMNGMIYIRGRNRDFQKWKDDGNPSWSPQNVNFYFKKAESFQNYKLLQNPYVRNTYGIHGPQVINSFNLTYRDTTSHVLESWDFMGFKRVNDINAATFKGLGICGIFAATAANGQRYSTYKSYLESIKNRENLKIVTNAFVTKILINDDKKSYGVQANILGEPKTFYAKKEIIISTGTINTPQLLMLSGIGPKDHLTSMNISCKVNLPGVGKNLHDHISVPILIYGDEPGEENQAERLFEVLQYMYNKTGYLGQNNFSDITVLFSRNQSVGYPEFQSLLHIFGKKSQSIQHLFAMYEDYIRNSFIKPNLNKSLYSFEFHLLHPISRGSIYLKSSDPYDYPIINANYFGEGKDLQDTIDGIKMLTKVVKTPYFKSINAFVHRVNISACNKYVFESDSYWKCYVINTSATVYHPVGTAKMGPNPKDSVVNDSLKVHGVKGLRVVDASIMPTITSGNTNAPTIMIGEMGSDMIKFDH